MHDQSSVRHRGARGAAAALLALAALAGCREVAAPAPPTLRGISISHTAFDMDVGSSVALTATSSSLESAPGTPAGLEWSSSDPRVLTVDQSGRVAGVGPGRAVVSVRLGRLTDSAAVRVGTRDTGGSPAWATVHGGGYFTCALDASGERFCWGENPFGAHGNGTRGLFTAVHSPVAAGDPLRYTRLTTGSFHACGITAAGEGYCWGNNSGRPTAQELTPQRLSAPPLREIASGAQHACALDTGGARYCWGSNLVGALGTATPQARQVEPLRVTEPVAFATLSSGFSHTCGLNAAGEAFCWGTAQAGELGEGSRSILRPVPHPVSGGLRFSSISAGNAATCALTPEGVAYCWGVLTLAGDQGLRRGESAVPVRVPTELRFAQVTVGAGHSCARTDEGEVFCWGLNDHGQAGVEPSTGPQCSSQYVNGTVPCAAVPNPVAPTLRFRQISAGRNHTCGVTVGSEVYCWGLNDRGQLGHGRIVPASARPVRAAASFR